jgi:hypothetical protein
MIDAETDQYRWTARLAERACEWTIAARCWDKAIRAFPSHHSTEYRRCYVRTMARRAIACRITADFFEPLISMVPEKDDPQP